MRSTVDIDEDLINEALKLSGLETKSQVIEEGLRLLVQVHGQEKVRRLRGKLRWEGSLDTVRQG